MAHSLYPLESRLVFNPIKQAWLPLAFTDELLLHTVLFTSVVHLSVVSGCRGVEESDNLMEPIFRQLSQRLQDKTKPSDATIGAVSCLAMVEVSSLFVQLRAALASLILATEHVGKPRKMESSHGRPHGDDTNEEWPRVN